MEHIFWKDENIKEYFECVTEAHNQFLGFVQDPQQSFEAMKMSPLESPDVMHGVPKDFGDMLLEITRYGEADAEDQMDVDTPEEKHFDEAKSELDSQGDFFVRHLSSSKLIERRSTDFGRYGLRSTMQKQGSRAQLRSG
jgi:hypothetical protein